jgi:hypothetical protein
MNVGNKRILHYFSDYEFTPLGRKRLRWVDNIKMNLREIRWNGMDWIDLAQDRDQWRAVMNFRVP